MNDKISVSEIFGMNVFDESVMAERLPKKIFKDLKNTIDNGEELNPMVAEVVANAMKDWAIEKGATHYTHWFQPMTGVTAEKHDSFISSPSKDGRVIMEFSGKELIKGEPDASSFPSGGLRATFEARGYTAWDCTSPAFLRENAAGVTLCIPTAFCSYTGEALDQKTPLLRSMEAINVQALRVLRLFGNNTATKVITSVGAEQEYFLVDKANYLKRKDLLFTGRTLFGAKPPKGQELDDHYFGTIKERVATFMRDLNVELWKLGVSAKTQHNEAAPAQHELAPIYATNNIAADHNQLIMEALKKIADRHNLACLLHEKPFAGVNGSGKHNNWSLITNEGENLLDPGKKPHENLRFLFVLTAVLRAVDIHADLVRMSAANPGNDLRLGANEAPPAIISVFLGEQLEDILDQLQEGNPVSSKKSEKLSTGVHTIPELKKDATDRNRTSPFAFTGNKFEFRMVGSSASISEANVVLNTIVADIFSEMVDELEKAENFEEALKELLRRYVIEHRRIIFSGNGYSEEWVVEANRRGLPNLKTMIDSIPSLITEKSVNLFEKHKVYSNTELHSRVEIYYESYIKAINIEAKTMIEMTNKQIIPAVIKFSKIVADSANAVVLAGADASVQKDLLNELLENLKNVKSTLKELEDAINNAPSMEEETSDVAHYYRDVIARIMNELRIPADKLETLVDREMWPFPTYGELLFEV